MRYAFQDKLTVIVTAADDLAEFETLIAEIDRADLSTIGVVSADQAGMMDMLSDDRFQGMVKAPLVIVHKDNASLAATLERYGISITKRNAAVGKQEAMLEAIKEDPYSADADSRTIEEIHGLEESDRWDHRTDEQRARDEEDKKKYNEAQKKGDISGDSFGPNPNRKRGGSHVPDKGTHVTDVRATTNADGSIEIDQVLAVKGSEIEEAAEGDAPEKSMGDLLKQVADAAGVEAPAADEFDGDSDDLSIDPNGMIAIYHKVEIAGNKLAHLIPPLAANDLELSAAAVRRNSSEGCWLAFIRQLQAEEWGAVLTKEGFTVEVYAVNDKGERLVPKGIQVVDTDAPKEVLPRVWNDLAHRIGKMTEEERKTNDETIKPGEFIFCGNYEGAAQGTIIYVTPLSYFKENGKMWEQPLDIARILPRDFKEVSPGVYRSTSRDWNHISFDMASRGFKENLNLQIALNAM